MRASWMRSTRTASTRSQIAVSVIGSASIAKPGLTPVPTTATFAFLAAASIFRASARFESHGYESSSVVETIGSLSLRTLSSCGHSFLRLELVQSTAACGFALRIAAETSAATLTPVFFARPTQLAQVLACLGGVDVDGRHHLEVAAGEKLAGDARPDRAQAHDHYLGRHEFGSLID